MDKKAAEARRAYKRAWAKAHPEKIREQQERYWKRKAEQGQNPAELPAQAEA